MSNAIAKQRNAMTRRVMISIAVGPREVDLPYVAPDGSKPIVVTTPNENLSEVIKRIEAAGGSANVILAKPRTFKIFTIEGVPMEGEPNEFNEDISMGMFDLKTRGTGSFTISGSRTSVSASAVDFAYAS